MYNSQLPFLPSGVQGNDDAEAKGTTTPAVSAISACAIRGCGILGCGILGCGILGCGCAAASRAERHVADTRSARGRTAGRRKGRSDAAEGHAGGPERRRRRRRCDIAAVRPDHRRRRRRRRCDIAAIVAVCARRSIVGSGTRSSTGYQNTAVG